MSSSHLETGTYLRLVLTEVDMRMRKIFFKLKIEVVMMADNFIIGGVHSCTHCLRYNPELCIEVWIANGDYSKLSVRKP